MCLCKLLVEPAPLIVSHIQHVVVCASVLSLSLSLSLTHSPPLLLSADTQTPPNIM